MNDNPAAFAFDTEVAIIGCGPVGATLANFLGLRGVRTVILEREAAAYHLPRAVHFDGEIMRVFQAIGLAGAMEAITTTSRGMLFVDAQGQLLLDWTRPKTIGPDGWYPSYRFHQPELEEVLRKGFARFPEITLRDRAEVFAIEQDAEAALIRFADLRTGRAEGGRARYVVGCDGARSLVRRLIGSAQFDLGFHERWLVVDVILKRPRPDLGEYSLQHCDPARPATYAYGTGKRRRWEISLLADEDPASMTEPAHVWPLLAKWITPDDADLERAAVYMFHSVIADGWRRGRLLIAGDAAHQTPPFLGQGMCAGLRDAANLGWKIERVLRGFAADGLLDTYERERAPHVRDYIELAVKLGGLINTKAAEAALVDKIPSDGGPARMQSIRPRLGPGLVAGDAALTGSIAPQVRLATGQRIDEHVGYRFAVLTKPAFAAQIPTGLRQALAKRDCVLIVDDGPEASDFLEAAGAAVAIRPDRYILGAANSLDQLSDLVAALGQQDQPKPLSVAS